MFAYHRIYPNNNILKRVADYSGPRYPYKYRAFVVDNNDPEQRARLKLQIPSVLGDNESDWAEPCVSPFLGEKTGCLWIPENNDYVWVTFEEGIPDFPIWEGGWSTANNTPNESGTYSSKQHIIQTPGGLRIILDDGSAGKEYIEIKDSAGNYIQWDTANGKITIAGTSRVSVGTGAKQVARVGDTVSVSGTDSHGDSFTATGTITAGSSLLYSD